MKKPFLAGMRDGVPIGLGYYAVAFSLGIIASKAGLTWWMGSISSFLTRASAGEYGVYSMIAVGAAYSEVIGLSIVANIRYLLMTTALTQKFREGTPLMTRIMTALCMTDEVFGISIAYPGPLAPSYTIGAMIVSTVMWSAGCASGIAAGDVLPANIVSALSVALYGMFLAIIIPPAKKDRAVMWAVAGSFVLSGLCAVMPWVSEMNSGTRIIILTILISAIIAWIKPIEDDNND